MALAKQGRTPPRHAWSERASGENRPKMTKRGDLAVLRQLWSQLKGWRRWLLAVLALDLLATPLALLSPVPLALAIDTALSKRPVPAILQGFVPAAIIGNTVWLLAFASVLQVVVAVLSGVVSWASSLVKIWLTERITLGLRERMLGHAQRLSFRFHDSRGSADSIYRIQYDAPAIANVGIYNLLPFLTSTFMFASMVGVVWAINPSLALVALSVSPVLVWSTLLYRARMKPVYKKVKRLESDALKIMQEVFSAIRVVKAFSMEKEEETRYSSQARMSMVERVRVARAEGAFSIFNAGTVALGTALVILIGGMNVDAGTMTVGALVLVVSYLSQLFGPLQSLASQSAKLQSQLVGAERAMELLEQRPDVLDPPDGLAVTRAKGAFALRDVTFGYEPEHPILDNVTLEIPAGARVGIVGRTGAGKSTLVGLLMRFYDVDSGAISMDGVDIRRYRLGPFRQQFAMVLQDPFLFSTTIRENLAYGRSGATTAEIKAAARAAGIHDFIAGLPEGYDTLVGERGMRLSGGERQRVSLARAFLRDAPILLLDEPTSSVDQETEQEILGAMEDLMANRTTFIIAHRLTTIRTCDMVLSIEDGQVRVLTDDALAMQLGAPLPPSMQERHRACQPTQRLLTKEPL